MRTDKNGLRKSILIIIMFFWGNVIFAQDTQMPSLLESDIPDCKITRSEIYDGNSLWGYINGGADVYLEYGFDKLLVQEAEINNQKITINIYKMNSPEAAFGIFSINKYKCLASDTAFHFSCVTKFQFQFAASDFYVSVISKNGTKEEQFIISEAAHILKRKINDNPPEFPSVFNGRDLLQYINELKYFNGILGLQNGFPDWIEMFEEYSGFSMYHLTIEDSSGYENVAYIGFKTSEDLNDFISKMNLKDNEVIENSGKSYFIKKEDDDTVVFSIYVKYQLR